MPVKPPQASGRGFRPSGPRLPAKPRKALGQHFLHDNRVLSRIIDEGGFTATDTVLEIGGGTGELSERLAAVVGTLVVAEIDELLSRHLRGRLVGLSNAHVVAADVLDHNPLDLLAEGNAGPPYAVAGNIPYHITAPIMRKFLNAEVRPQRMVLMVQREVAETLAAAPGKLTLLAVSVQLYASVRVLFTVPPSSFTPPPKVDSAVIRIDVHPQPVVAVPDEERFFAVVRAGFRNPRKQLHNALASGLWLPPGVAPDLLAAAGIEVTRRAQTLSLDEWASLATAYHTMKPSWETVS